MRNRKRLLERNGRASTSASQFQHHAHYFRVESRQLPVILHTEVQYSFIDREFHDECQMTRPHRNVVVSHAMQESKSKKNENGDRIYSHLSSIFTRLLFS